MTAVSKPPLVLVVHQGAEMYGSDRVLLYLMRGLRERGRYAPLVVLPGPGPLHGELVAAGVEVHFGEVMKVERAMLRPAGLARLPAQAWRALRRLDDVVGGREVALVHSNTLAVLAGALWAQRRRRRHLWHVHEIILKPRPVAVAFPWLVDRLSDRVIANSTATQRWLLEARPRLAGRSHIVFNGLPAEASVSQADAESFRQRIGARPGDLVATIAGRLNHWKGQGLLIEAASLLKQQGRLAPWRIAIVGAPFAGQEHIREALRRQVVDAGLGDSVSFVDFVNDIAPVWHGSDVAVVASTEPEPFGMVAIEAMAAGLPVIAAGHGGLTDIVVHDETGQLFRPRDAQALADALVNAADDVRRRRWGESGRARQAANFSLQAQVEQTEALYDAMRAAS